MSMNRGMQRGKTALVLAGGGLTGAVYEIGALRAVDDLLVDRTVNDLDIYIGTSAGAFVAAGLANGMTPEMLLQAIDGSHPEVRPIERQHLFTFNTRETLRRTLGLPRALLNAGVDYLRHRRDLSLFDLIWSLSEALPSGLYDGLALEHYVRQLMTNLGRSNSFTNLERELHIIATDLETGQRVVFGPDHYSEVPISLAVAASSALPVLYKPVRIGGREYVDGGLRGTASLDLAIERGATLVLCINPLVPYEYVQKELAKAKRDQGYLSDRGLRAIASQVARIALHAGLHYHIKQLRRRHPEVDIILIEPRPDDYQMFFYNVMHYPARLTIARHGYESVTLDLAEKYFDFKNILARHDVPLSRRLVIQELAEIQASDYDPAVLQRVLERRDVGCDGRKNTPTCQLDRTLTELDLVLEMGVS